MSDKDETPVMIPNLNGVTNFQLIQQQMQTNQPLSTTQIHSDQFQFKVFFLRNLCVIILIVIYWTLDYV